jgi:hypothetical protein
MGPPENTRALINNIISLTRALPISVPLATNADKIYAMARANHYNILATGIVQLLCILFPV